MTLLSECPEHPSRNTAQKTMLRKEIQEKLVTNMAELTTTGRDIGEEKIFEKSFQGRGDGKANYANSERRGS